MSKSKRLKLSRIIFIVFITLMIIPQTRKSIQVFLQKGIAQIVKPSVIDASERLKLANYDWKLKDVNGKDFDFSSAEGKVIVINFWATWCPPCIAEMPSLERLYQNYESNSDVVFLFVSNEEIAIINNFINDKKYTFNVYRSLINPPQKLDVTSIPRTFIIDRQGKIVIDKTGAADWNSKKVIAVIEKLIKAS